MKIQRTEPIYDGWTFLAHRPERCKVEAEGYWARLTFNDEGRAPHVPWRVRCVPAGTPRPEFAQRVGATTDQRGSWEWYIEREASVRPAVI